MGLFDLWRPEPQKNKPGPAPSSSVPFGLPQREAEHLLPSPAPVAPKPKPQTIKELFSYAAPKEVPKPQSKPAKSLLDALVPEAERGGVYRGNPGIFERAEPEREPREAKRPSPPRQTYGWALPTPEEFAGRLPGMFNLELVWDEARSGRRLPWFKSEAKTAYQSGEAPALPLVAVAPVSDYDVLGYFFGIPRHVMDSYLQGVPRDQEVHAANQFWDEILWPLFDMTTAAFELLKPEDLPGWFRLDISPMDLSLVELQYLEMSR